MTIHDPNAAAPARNCPDADEALSFAFMQKALMDELRLYHAPVGVRFLFSDEEVESFRKTTPHVVPNRPLTFCQWELAARMQGKAVLGTPEKLFCTNAQVGFGWREIDDNEIRSHLKYCRDGEQARRFVEAKPRMPLGAVKAVAAAPLGLWEEEPHVVHFVCDSMQAYHLAVDFMAATDIHPLPTQVMMNSSSCGGCVHCHQTGLYNFTTPCSGSYNSGKMERGESNVFIPGPRIRAVVGRMLERIAQRGSSSVTTPGDPFPGSDICKNCPLIRFHRDGETCPGCGRA